MDLAYGLPLLAVLVIGWIAVRRAIGRPRRRLRKYSKWREQRGTMTQQAGSGSTRSDMRAYDDPTTTMNSLEKERWKGAGPSSGGRHSSSKKKR